jgi:hypothetical protein
LLVSGGAFCASVIEYAGTTPKIRSGFFSASDWEEWLGSCVEGADSTWSELLGGSPSRPCAQAIECDEITSSANQKQARAQKPKRKVLAPMSFPALPIHIWIATRPVLRLATQELEDLCQKMVKPDLLQTTSGET